MTFYSLQFLILFFVICIAVQYANSPHQQHMIFLLGNVVFYGYWDYRFLLLLMYVILLCYMAGIWYEKRRTNSVLTTGIILCVLTLAIFKYFNFFIDTFETAFNVQNISTLEIILPLGISFYILQAISYLFDIRNRTIPVEHDLIKFATYISFFPQITSGPIMKAHDFLPQLNFIHRITKENVYKGTQLFLMGLTKKIVIADCLGVAVDAVYNAPLAYNGLSILFAILGYSFQIYADFSGYSDMAIGIATILGFNFGKNFNIPYIATNPSDFWRRWHISLSSWLKEYIYIPLGGNRRGSFRTYLNIIMTMLVSGLWHGTNINFIVWGFLYGVASSINKLWRSMFFHNERACEIFGGFLGIVMNFVFVSFAWVIFRANSMQHVYDILSGLLRTDGINFVNVYTVIYIIFLTGLNIASYFLNDKNEIIVNMDLDQFKNKVIISVWLFLILMFMHVGESTFIYAQM